MAFKLGHINSILDKSGTFHARFVPFGANLTQFGCQLSHPALYLNHGLFIDDFCLLDNYFPDLPKLETWTYGYNVQVGRYT